MRCPRCDFDQPEGAECARCGIIIARFQSRPAAQRPTAPRPAVGAAPRECRDRPSYSRSAITYVALFLLVAFAGVWLWRRLSHTAPPRKAQAANDATTSPLPAVSPTPRSPLVVVGRDALVEASPTPAKRALCPFLSISAPPFPSRPSVPAYWLEGSSGYERAEQTQRLSGAPVLAYFFTDWCPYCREFERSLLNSVDTERYLRDTVIRVRVNPEKGEEDRKLATRFGVTGFPALFLILPGADARRLSTRDKDGGESRLKTEDEFIAQITERIAHHVRRKVHDAYQARQGGDPTAAIDVLDSVAALRPEETETYLQRAMAHADNRDGGRALEDLRRAYELTPDEIRVFQQADAMLASESRWDEIAACWSSFLDRHPDDARAHIERGGALFRKGDRDGARREAADACRLGESRGCDLVAQLGD